MARPERTELRPKEARAIAALLCEPTVEAAARSAKVGDRTLRRWLERPELAEELARRGREAMTGAMGSLRAATVEAVEALRAIVTDPDSPPAARVSAARVVLEQAQRAIEREANATVDPEGDGEMRELLEEKMLAYIRSKRGQG
jgi:hypothetical protein